MTFISAPDARLSRRWHTLGTVTVPLRGAQHLAVLEVARAELDAADSEEFDAVAAKWAAIWRGAPEGSIAVRSGLIASLLDARDQARSANKRATLAAIVERASAAVRAAYGLRP